MKYWKKELKRRNFIDSVIMKYLIEMGCSFGGQYSLEKSKQHRAALEISLMKNLMWFVAKRQSLCVQFSKKYVRFYSHRRNPNKLANDAFKYTGILINK
jgi:hypothetical protein